MLSSEDKIKPGYIIEIVSRYRWLIMIPFCLFMVAGIGLALKLPRVYSARTLILVQPQRVPANYVQSLITTDIDTRINTMSQQIMSRTNLEKIIEEFDLFSGPKYEKMYKEDKIENLRKQISVELMRDNGRKLADAFAISFKGKEPEKVMRVTNALATYFIDENLKFRETQAVGTSDFLDDELGSMGRRLEELEKALKEYRERYMGALPEQLETNLRILDRLQEQLSEKQEGLRDARSRLLALENQVSDTLRQPDRLSLSLPDHSREFEADDQTALAQLKKKLADLQTRYTARHPDILAAEKKIADLEAKIKEGVEETEGKTEPAPALQKLPPVFQEQREEIKREISSLEADIPALLNQLKIYQQRVEDTPKREQELLSLKRDYQNIRDSYNSLLERKLEAEIAVNMEKKQKGEQFRILDPARLPEKPIEPNMKRLFLLMVAGGLGIGAGLIFLLEYLDTSFRKPEEIEAFLGVPLLAAVPVVRHDGQKRKMMINRVLSIFSMAISIVLFAGFSALTLAGADQIMEFVGKYLNL